MADENDDRAVGFVNSDGMTLAIIVGNTRRHFILGMPASSKHDCKADKRSRDAERTLAIEGYLGCHLLCPRPASVGDKAVGAAIIPGRLDAARSAVNAIDAAQEIGFSVRGICEALTPAAHR